MGDGSYDVAIKLWQEKTIDGRKLESIRHKEIVTKNIYSQGMGANRTVSTHYKILTVFIMCDFIVVQI